MATEFEFTRYERIGEVSFVNSQVDVVRRFSVREPWRNFMQYVETEGVFANGGTVKRYEGGGLAIEKFYGSLILPASRKTNLVAQNSKIKGDHPLGRVQTDGGTLDLREPDYLEGLPKEAKYAVSMLIDLGIIGAITGVAHTISSVAGSVGMSWPVDISLLVGAGADMGIRHRNALTTTLSMLVAGGAIFMPEVLGRDTLGVEDLAKVAGTVASGFVGKGIRQLYDNMRS